MIETLPITLWKELRGKKQNAVLLDVRTPREFSKKRLQGSVNVPLDRLIEEMPERFPDLNTPLYLYCRSGNRSAMAAKILEKMGYHTIVDLGGIIDWPYETVNG